MPAHPPTPSSRFMWAAYLLGFGFGGFFDGILLHQVLQWHHLLSAIQQGPLVNLRGQIVADGLFHALMYLIAGGGLVLLARSRGELELPGAARVLLAGFLIGFGIWHVADSVISHWVTGIHRIRMDSDNPLFWDLVWFVAFGLVPIALGIWRRTIPSSMGGVTAAVLLVVGTAVGGGFAARPPDPSMATVTVVLRPGAAAGGLLRTLSTTDTRIVWSDPRGEVWVFKASEDLSLLALYREGAMFVSGTMTPAGCSAWVAESGRAL